MKYFFSLLRVLAERLRRATRRSVVGGSHVEFGQASVEYALVLLGAAIVATVLIGWATNNNVLSGLFDFVVNTVKGKVK